MSYEETGVIIVRQDEVTTMSKRQCTSVFVAVGCVVTGAVLYFLFRPTTLLMFRWADSLGLTELIGTMRSWVYGFDEYLPNWAIYSLPFALWVSSYLLLIDSIWGRSRSLVFYVWFWCIPIIAIAAETAQSMQFLPGHFDMLDLIAIIFAVILGLVATIFNQSHKGVQAS